MMNSSQPQHSSLPERDIELLSAYLDNQLSVAERVNLERRMEGEPALRDELEDLRGTAAALRALELMRPPRSFTLDPATVARPRFFFPLTWVMQMGSGLAGLALVLLATVQLIGAGGSPAIPMAAKEAPASAAQAPLATEAPAMMMESAPASSAADSARQAEPTAAPAAQAMPAAEPTAAPEAAGSTSAFEPPATAGEAAAGSAAPAGGTADGPLSNSSAPADTVQASESSSPGTVELPAEQASAGQPRFFPPGLTLAIGAALIGLAGVWHLYSRRRT